MNSNCSLAVAIGIIAGLRALTGPAVICWIAHPGVIHLQGTRLSFMNSAAAVAIFTVLAIVEIVNDRLPKTPAPTVAVPFGENRDGNCCRQLGMAGGGSVSACAVLGLVGAILGTYGGYFARTGIVKALHSPDFSIALLEDVVAIGGAILIVSRL
jgi:uncharacterized membrane protein